ncbi:MAG: hypothetical protein M0P16_09820 [Syntrophales bacterium]|jgi:hypothetical protein|nr:hypothetical protein [Syntrophales bacterium]MCK9390228.1 hypothetical protein [Syntrophales bacterium]
MKKLLSIIVSMLFALSVSGLAFAQAAPAAKPAAEPVKAEEKAPAKADKKKAPKAKKAKKAKKAPKADVKADDKAPAAEKK